MRVLAVHESYRERGGEDAVFEAECELLRAGGHEVVEHRVHNDEVARVPRLRLFAGTVWSRAGARALRAIAERARPDVAHFHNTLPLISPAAYRAVRRTGAAVVQTLHNYRLVCPSALLFRAGRVCEDCVGRTPPWPAVWHGCYRGSRAASAAVATMLTVHRWLGTWREQVDAYIALTSFMRGRIVAGGVPAERVAIKPNFLAVDPGAGTGARAGVLFAGRLTVEKGVRVLLAALDALPADTPVRIAGAGPLAAEVEARAAVDARVAYLGPLARDALFAEMRSAAVLAVPSLWFEGFPMTIVEAFACGLPVVASRIGGMADVIAPGRDGALVEPGDARALADSLVAVARRPALGVGARESFVRRYSAVENLSTLERIYAEAIASRRCGRPPRADPPDAAGGASRNRTTAEPRIPLGSAMT